MRNCVCELTTWRIKEQRSLDYLTMTTPFIWGWNVQMYEKLPACVNVCCHDCPEAIVPELNAVEVAV